jgi:hypothetical protein
MLLTPTTWALISEALRAVATDLDQQAATMPPWDPAPQPSPSPTPIATPTTPLPAEELSAVREQAFSIIQSVLTSSPTTATEQVAAVLKQFDAARISDLTAVTAPLALKALQKAFPQCRPQ